MTNYSKVIVPIFFINRSFNRIDIQRFLKTFFYNINVKLQYRYCKIYRYIYIMSNARLMTKLFIRNYIVLKIF